MKKIYQILLLTLLLSGCAVDGYPSESIPKNVYDISTQFINDMSAGKIDSCISNLDAEAQTYETKVSLSKYEFNMNKHTIVSSRIIAYVWKTVFGSDKFTLYQVDYEYKYTGNKWVHFSIIVLIKADTVSIKAFRYQIHDEPLGLKNEFTFQGKTFIHYLWLLITAIVPLFIIVTIVFVVRTKFKRKWMWIIFILFGFVSLSMNWTSGEIDYQIFSIRPLGSGYVKSSLIGPWILSFSMPVGAILFWFKRKNILKKQNEIPIVSDLENNKEIV